MALKVYKDDPTPSPSPGPAPAPVGTNTTPRGHANYGGTIVIKPDGTPTLVPGDPNATDNPPGGGGGGGTSAAAAAAKANSKTRSQAEAQRGLIDAFGAQRDTKLEGIDRGLTDSDSLLLQNYQLGLKGLEGSRDDNAMAESDASFGNVANAVRERASILDQTASLGAGESDAMRAQLTALRNYSANQGEVNRSFFDTLRNVNNATNSLNSDTATSRVNLFNQAEADKESAWANYYNQTADTWTQINNIENSQFNDPSYTAEFADSGAQAAAAARGAYSKKSAPGGYTDWAGKGQSRDTQLTSSNRAAAITLGGPQKSPEGATLRRDF